MREKDLRALGAIVLFYVLLELLGVTCPIKFLTGISCPGCGMSRAWLAALRLDWRTAFAFHPLFPLPVPAAGLLLFRKKMPEKIFRWGTGIVCALFLVVYVIRLLTPEDPIAVFAPSQGLIGRLVSGFTGTGGI